MNTHPQTIITTFTPTVYHDTNSIKLAKKLDCLCKEIGLIDYEIYVSNSGLTFGVKKFQRDHSGVPGRANDMVMATHNCNYHDMETTATFFQRFGFLVEEKNEKYFSAKCEYILAINEILKENILEEKKTNSDLREKIHKVEKIINFNPLFPSKRNASRLRGLGKKVLRYKIKNSK